jgi:hypothetical protein
MPYSGEGVRSLRSIIWSKYAPSRLWRHTIVPVMALDAPCGLAPMPNYESLC